MAKPNAKHTRTLVTRPPDARPAERFEVGDTGGSASFAFGRKGFRSSVWNVAVSPKGDIYINERAVAAELKTSLHASGDWWHGFVKDQQSKGLTPSGDAFSAATGSRVFDVHRRPEAGAGGAAGVTPAQTIFVTQDDVQAWPNDDVNRAEIVWSDAPLAGQVAMFQILLMTPKVLTLTEFVGITGMVAVIGTQTGEVVSVISQLLWLDDAELAVAAECRAQFREQYTDEQVANLRLGPGEHIRSQVIMATSDGHREVWDLACQSRWHARKP